MMKMAFPSISISGLWYGIVATPFLSTPPYGERIEMGEFLPMSQLGTGRNSSRQTICQKIRHFAAALFIQIIGRSNHCSNILVASIDTCGVLYTFDDANGVPQDFDRW